MEYLVYGPADLTGSLQVPEVFRCDSNATWNFLASEAIARSIIKRPGCYFIKPTADSGGAFVEVEEVSTPSLRVKPI
jgi:hypothetical protein